MNRENPPWAQPAAAAPTRRAEIGAKPEILHGQYLCQQGRRYICINLRPVEKRTEKKLSLRRAVQMQAV